VGLIRAGVKPDDSHLTETLSLIRNRYLSEGRRPPTNLPWRERPHALKLHYWTALALLEAAEPLDSPVIKEALEAIRTNVAPDHGWASTEKNTKPKQSNILDSYHIMEVLSLANVQKDAVTKASGWIASIQNQDGGWGYFRHERSDPLCTAAGILALTQWGKKERRKIESAVRWLTDHQIVHENPPGRWRISYEVGHGRGDAYVYFTTPYVVRGLLAAGLAPSTPAIQDAVSYLVKTQQPDGGWTLMGENMEFPFAEKMCPLSYFAGQALMGLARYYGTS
jgi:prenyltransferase beta subunit